MTLLAIDFESLHLILKNLYGDMMHLCEDMTGIAKGIAGLGALFYIATRVWQSLARAEPIDVYPLLRPIAIGLCIMGFSWFVLPTINGVLSPIVTGTHQILEDQMLNMDELSEQKNRLEYEALKRNPETAYLVDKEEWDKKLQELGIWDAPELAGMLIEKGFHDFKQWIQRLFRELLELIFNSCALVIDTLRTFFLIVLSILGPIAFAIGCWDGFQSTIPQWITRYISVYFWLPVADLFSAVLARIQSNIITVEINKLEDLSYVPDGANAVYIVFMIIGIIGYFTVPTVANWIISAGGMGNYGKNVSQAAVRGGAFAGGVAGSVAGNLIGKLKNSGSSSDSSTTGSSSDSGSGTVNGNNKSTNS